MLSNPFVKLSMLCKPELLTDIKQFKLRYKVEILTKQTRRSLALSGELCTLSLAVCIYNEAGYNVVQNQFTCDLNKERKP